MVKKVEVTDCRWYIKGLCGLHWREGEPCGWCVNDKKFKKVSIAHYEKDFTYAHDCQKARMTTPK